MSQIPDPHDFPETPLDNCSQNAYVADNLFFHQEIPRAGAGQLYDDLSLYIPKP